MLLSAIIIFAVRKFSFFLLFDEEFLQVSLPKFKSELKLDLSKPLKAMGILDAFSNVHADFSGISSSPQYISGGVQKAFIEVDYLLLLCFFFRQKTVFCYLVLEIICANTFTKILVSK